MDEGYKKPVIAICYDFDKTLSPDDMQAQGFIQSLGYDVKDFWQESNGLAADNDMDQNLAYMYMMTKKSRRAMVFNKEKIMEYGSKLRLFPGVESWFKRINSFGTKQGVEVEHYIISSGLKEMIEGSKIADQFKKIYASSFYYDQDGIAVWPAQVVNYTNKTQFLFRIEKGVLDVNDAAVNDFYPPDKIKIPFRNIIYIGDSDTDVPCMKLVNSYGGYSIGVYNSDTKDKSKVYKMLRENRIRYFVPADYSRKHPLEKLVQNIIRRTKENEILENMHYQCENEMNQEFASQPDEQQRKADLINRLEESGSFSQTHKIIEQMNKVSNWSPDEKKRIIRIGQTNHQVAYILEDEDIAAFYKKLVNCKLNLNNYNQETHSIA